MSSPPARSMISEKLPEWVHGPSRIFYQVKNSGPQDTLVRPLERNKDFADGEGKMAKVIFTAWKTKAQLLDVRSEFYPPSLYNGPDMRSHACATVCEPSQIIRALLKLMVQQVEAWKLRGNVPHHVEATALLTDAILHDDGQRNSIFSIRATYSAAFCRYVVPILFTRSG